MNAKSPLSFWCRTAPAILMFLGAGLHAAPHIYYAAATSDVKSATPGTGAAGPTIPSNLFKGASPGAARNIQIDPNTNLLWYSNSSGFLDSIRLSDLSPGPSISSAVFHGANPGADRHFSIDPVRSLLYASSTDNSVQIIDLKTKSHAGKIISTRFHGGAVGGLRHTTVDYVNNIMYYASTDNSIRSFHLKTFAVGPMIPSNRVKGAASGAFRHLIYNPNTRLLHYVTAGNTIESINPVTLKDGPSIASNKVLGGATGAGRPITIDAPLVTVDQKAPKVTVKGKRFIKTGKTRWVIRGTAKDPGGVKSVTYRINSGKLRTATGKKFWKIPVKLKRKVTTVRIYATDKSNNRSRPAKVRITRK